MLRRGGSQGATCGLSPEGEDSFHRACLRCYRRHILDKHRVRGESELSGRFLEAAGERGRGTFPTEVSRKNSLQEIPIPIKTVTDMSKKGDAPSYNRRKSDRETPDPTLSDPLTGLPSRVAFDARL